MAWPPSVTFACLIIGIFLAWLTTRTRLPGRRGWAVVAALPLAVPSYVAAYAWVAAFPRIPPFVGSVLVLTLCCYPYVLLPVAGTLHRTDPALEEVARSLGKGQLATFLTVTLRQVRPAAAVGGLLVALYVLSDFGAVAILRYDVFTRVIYTSYRSSFDGTAAAALGLVLVAITLTVVVGRGTQPGPRGSGPDRLRCPAGAPAGRARPHGDVGRPAGAARWPALALGFPLGSLTYWLVQGRSADFDPAALGSAAVSTVAVSALGAVTDDRACDPGRNHGGALPVARGPGARAGVVRWPCSARHRRRAVAGVLRRAFRLSRSTSGRRCSYWRTPCCSCPRRWARCAPRSPSRPRCSKKSHVHWVAAPARVLRDVTLPLAGPGVAAGAALVFLTCMKELPATLAASPHRAGDARHGAVGRDRDRRVRGRGAVCQPARPARGGAHVPARAAPPVSHTGLPGGRIVSELVVRGLEKSFGSVRVLEELDLVVPAGRLAAVLGPSGCGKTTLLRIVAGFETADRGTVVLAGVQVAGPGVHLPPERRRVGVVPQEGALFPHLTVAGNVGFGLSRAQRRAGRIDELLGLVGLGGFGHRMPYEFSGGQQQRIALARALAPEPALVLLDEPFSALDTGLRAAVREDVRSALRAAGATAVLVTHDQEEALSMADLVAVMGVATSLRPPPRASCMRPRQTLR